VPIIQWQYNKIKLIAMIFFRAMVYVLICRECMAMSEEATRMCEEATRSDSTEAAEKALAAFRLLRGSSDNIDVSKAFEMLQRSASLNNAAAQNTLGIALQNGVLKTTTGSGGGESRESAAAEWFLRASEQGDPAANNNYGLLLAKGSITSSASPLAFFLRAAKLGHQGAMYNAGFALVQATNSNGVDDGGDSSGGGGKGSGPDLEAALKWFHAAATADPNTKVAANARLAISQLEADAATPVGGAVDAGGSGGARTEAASGAGAGDGEGNDLSDRSNLLPCPRPCTQLWDGGVAEFEAFSERFSRLQVVDSEGFERLRATVAHFTELAVLLQGSRADGEGFVPAAAARDDDEGGKQRDPSSSSSSSATAWTVARAGAVLSQLQQAFAALARADVASELAVAGEVSAALAQLPTCRSSFALHESSGQRSHQGGGGSQGQGQGGGGGGGGSCWNAAVSSAATYLRRAGLFEDAEAVATVLAHNHEQAATQYASSLQVPLVYFPGLEAKPWWDARQFPLARALERSHELVSGDLDALLALQASPAAPRSDSVSSTSTSSSSPASPASSSPLLRVLNPAAPIAPSSVEADSKGSGVWSEYTLFDGKQWDAEHCAVMATTCALVANFSSSSSSSGEDYGEVCGGGGTRDPSVCGTQVVATVFRLAPGSRVQPHTGTTNRRLVLQFAIRGSQGVRFRVGEEWRSYDQGSGGRAPPAQSKGKEESRNGGGGGGGNSSTCSSSAGEEEGGGEIGGRGDGKALVFDDSFEHEVVHGGSEDRFVLYVALHHPGHAVWAANKQRGGGGGGGGGPASSSSSSSSVDNGGLPLKGKSMLASSTPPQETAESARTDPGEALTETEKADANDSGFSSQQGIDQKKGFIPRIRNWVKRRRQGTLSSRGAG